MTRMIAAIVLTVLAALTLYFVFLHGKRPADSEVQPTDHYLRYSPASEAASLRYPMPVSE
ncbi:hypothetical protein [Candidatus Mycobacterium methanotrophicum]|uniref:hypothetical protein n=1 Tax=Candidatus Mycobacterium methanotrophicum TaxID=2943498 RepID=UPI001C588BAE|nr:hypothetical protein [Candidatus Mycobacterium methanotrophicum]